MKKVMTRKEWMQEHHPDLCGSNYAGGVAGCPGEFEELCFDYGECKGYKDDELQGCCDKCWSQKIEVEVPEPRKKGLWQRIKEAFSRV